MIHYLKVTVTQTETVANVTSAFLSSSLQDFQANPPNIDPQTLILNTTPLADTVLFEDERQYLEK